MRAMIFVLNFVGFLGETRGQGFGFGYSQQNGNERLLGSSFGFPGTDQTFDYVVRICKNFGQYYALCLAEVPSCF